MYYKKSWQNLLTICRKAGKLVMGLDPAKDAIFRGEAAGVLAALDVSEKSRKEAAYFCGLAGLHMITLPFTKAEMGQLIGRASGIYGVCDAGFFRRMQTMAENTEQI